MNKGLRNFLIVIFSLFIFLKLTGMFTYYNVPSSSNEPNLPTNCYIFGSNLLKPKRNDFAYFKFSDSLDGYTIVKRLIALPGDRLECKKGNYFVNEKNVDKDLNLRFSYVIDNVSFGQLKPFFEGDDGFEYYPISKDSIFTFLDNDFVSKFPLKLKRHVSTEKSNLFKGIFSKSKTWDLNNFGPITIPEGKYFFSGDNRENSIDSRYRGFVDEKEIKGTLLFKL
ncbi:signal peptidase I [Hyunsoonleella sp. 2307UL5-6]|uniref:signal peptidase I n=1 Tax=Hyunsoonleella sp. 2307UL5-6 TaxID=3384768 RepID=UPI0039BD7A3A